MQTFLQSHPPIQWVYKCLLQYVEFKKKKNSYFVSISNLLNLLSYKKKNGLEIVSQPLNLHAKSPISSPSLQTRPDWETVGNQNQQVGPSSIPAKNEIRSELIIDIIF